MYRRKCDILVQAYWGILCKDFMGAFFVLSQNNNNTFSFWFTTTLLLELNLKVLIYIKTEAKRLGEGGVS